MGSSVAPPPSSLGTDFGVRRPAPALPLIHLDLDELAAEADVKARMMQRCLAEAGAAQPLPVGVAPVPPPPPPHNHHQHHQQQQRDQQQYSAPPPLPRLYDTSMKGERGVCSALIPANISPLTLFPPPPPFLITFSAINRQPHSWPPLLIPTDIAAPLYVAPPPPLLPPIEDPKLITSTVVVPSLSGTASLQEPTSSPPPPPPPPPPHSSSSQQQQQQLSVDTTDRGTKFTCRIFTPPFAAAAAASIIFMICDFLFHHTFYFRIINIIVYLFCYQFFVFVVSFYFICSSSVCVLLYPLLYSLSRHPPNHNHLLHH